jgi:hypothetical protein
MLWNTFSPILAIFTNFRPFLAIFIYFRQFLPFCPNFRRKTCFFLKTNVTYDQYLA